MSGTLWSPHFCATAMALAMTAAACATTPAPSAALDQARAQVEAAAGDASVRELAPGEVQEAQAILANAESAAEGGDAAEATHQAYLAMQQATVAQETAKYKQAESAFKNAEAERSRILLEARTSEADQERARAQELQEELAGARQTSRGLVLTLGNVLFTTDSASLAPGAASSIDRLATFLRDNPDRTVLIEGYTDSTGSSDYNQRLSQQRADAVRSALVARGVDPGRIETAGLGEASPVASNDDVEGRQMNRRVEVVISEASPQPTAAGTPTR